METVIQMKVDCVLVCYDDQDRKVYVEIISFNDENEEDRNILSMINIIDD